MTKEKVKFYHGTSWISFCNMNKKGWKDIFFTDLYNRAKGYANMNPNGVIIEIELYINFPDKKSKRKYLKRKKSGDFIDVVHSSKDSTCCNKVHLLKNKL